MALSRRHFLQLLPAGIISNSLADENLGLSQELFISSCDDSLDKHSLCAFTRDGLCQPICSLPSRGHGFCIVEKDVGDRPHLIAVARRPADYFVVLEKTGDSLQQIKKIKCPKGRHFYGHATVSEVTNLLYLAENDFEQGRGMIGVYDTVNDYKRVSEFPAYGIGTHEIQLTKDRAQLIVANGGIQTHPESGRKPLNLDSMQPSVAVIDVLTGQLVHQASLDESQRFNSIRHMAVSDSGEVFFALQHKGKKSRSVGEVAGSDLLLMRYRVGINPSSSKLYPIDIPEAIQKKLHGYIGDISFDSSQRYFAATSPRGNTILFFNLHGLFLQAQSVADICGLESTDTSGQFIATTGHGKIFEFTLPEKSTNFEWQQKEIILEKSVDVRWDNHLQRLT